MSKTSKYDRVASVIGPREERSEEGKGRVVRFIYT
jgi:hypothetical protein